MLRTPVLNHLLNDKKTYVCSREREMKHNTSIILAILTVTLVFTRIVAMDEVDYSTVPPDSMDPQTLPQLICLGFDDNKWYSGMKWAMDMLQDKTNPAGVGNKATFDGTPVRATFFLIAHEFYLEEIDPWVFDTIEYPLGDSILTIRKELYTQGHEIGNHTRTHNISSPLMDKDDWRFEVLTCSKYIVNDMGVPPMDIYGFRTPYLDYSAIYTFYVLKELNLLYDCTLEDGSFGSSSGESHIYPHTMHKGHLFLPTIIVPGFWELPHCAFATGSGTYNSKGFDSNLWPVAQNSIGASASQFLSILKSSLDRRYNGNRASMDIGLHSDYYSPDNTGVNFNASCDARRKALEDFIDYALSLTDVRIVPMIKFIEWMRHPVPLDDTSLNEMLTFNTADPSSNLIHATATISTDTDNLGSSLTTAVQNSIVHADVTLNAQMSNNAIPGYADISIELAKSMQKVKAMKVVYKSDFPLKISLPQEPLAETKNSFKIEMPSCSDWKTKELIVNSCFFKKPRSCPSNLDDIELDLAKVTSITFSPVLLDTTLQGSLELKEVVCYGAGEIGNTAIKNIPSASAAHELTIDKITPHLIYITIPVTGTYSIDLFDIKGRTVATLVKRNLAPGTYTVPWDSEVFGSSMYLLQIKIEGKEMVRTFIKM